ncbi:MAG: hypothetical protein ACJ77K_10180 [Bacteroidia bacterium]
MKKFLFSSILFLYINTALAQTGVFKTFDDYKAGNLTVMDEEMKVNAGIASILTFQKDGQKIKYSPKEIWGFLYKGYLFRCYGNTVYYVESNGKVILYVNSYAIWYQVKKDQIYAIVYSGPIYSLSNSLNERIYSTSFCDTKKVKPKLIYTVTYKDFIRAHPQHQELFDCIGSDYDQHTLESCVDQYNERAKTE